MPTREKETYSIQSVENALNVLEALCDEGDEVGISQLSERLGMNKTSVFRLLATFENRGYVERETRSGKYRLGLSAYEIGQKLLSRMGLLRKARPVMEHLVRECDEAVYLAVRRLDQVLFFDMVDTSQQVKIVSLVGKRYPLNATAAGKVILSHLPLGEVSQEEWPQSPRAVLASIADELEIIRTQSTCHDHNTLGDGIASMAVPLFSGDGHVQGSLSLIAPDFRMTEEKIRDYLIRLRESADIISSKLGYVGRYLQKEYS